MSDKESKDVEHVTQTDNVLLKQYEMMGAFYDNESQRYWVRFNIFIGIQLAALIAIITQIQLLVLNPGIFRGILVFFGILSILILIIVHRGLISIKLIYTLAKEIESLSEGKLKLMSMLGEHTKVTPLVNQFISSVIALLFTVMWWSVFIYLETISYKIKIPTP